MTIQNNLSLVWAIEGSALPFEDADPESRYKTGWVSEIPTYENFNYVLQDHSKNLLVLAESSGFTWQNDINYKPGALVISGDKEFYCHLANINKDPATDSTQSYWRLSESWGAAHTYSAKTGAVNNVMFARGIDTWLGQDQTIINSNNAFVLFADTSGRTNILFGLSDGELVTKYVGNRIEPNGQNINPDGTDSAHRIFHEGHPPVQTEVSGTIPDAPNDSYWYGRHQNDWIRVAGADGLKPFPQGTRMLFAQAAAPTGWTQDTSDKANHRMLRVTTETGWHSGGTDDCTKMDKVPTHTHEVGTTINNRNHRHHLTLTSGIQSIDHQHYINFKTQENDNTHTHGSGTYKTDTTGSHGHSVGRGGKDSAGYSNLMTGSNPETDYLYTAKEGSHSHDVKGTCGSQSGNHKHVMQGNVGSNNKNHTHKTTGYTGYIPQDESHSHGALCDYNKDGDFSLKLETGVTETRSNSNTGDWEPKYLDVIVCVAN